MPETPNEERPIGSWPIAEGFICGSCGDAARVNPADEREWGCAACSGSTHSIALHFLPAPAIITLPR